MHLGAAIDQINSLVFFCVLFISTNLCQVDNFLTTSQSLYKEAMIQRSRNLNSLYTQQYTFHTSKKSNVSLRPTPFRLNFCLMFLGFHQLNDAGGEWHCVVNLQLQMIVSVVPSSESQGAVVLTVAPIVFSILKIQQ